MRIPYPPTRSKYGNKRVEVDGYRFDSLAEAEFYGQLKIMERAGQLTALEVHPRYKLLDGFRDANGKWHQPIWYEADFSFYERASGKTVVIDVKGHRTTAYLLKKKLFLYKYGRLYDFREIQA